MSEIPLGRPCWYELMTTDPDAAADFYGQIAGWGTAPFEGGPTPYTMWMNGETPIGGYMQLPEESQAAGAPSHWLVHISTPNIEETATKAAELGGTVLTRMEVPTVGEFAIIQDPQGAVFSAFQPATEAPGHDVCAALKGFDQGYQVFRVLGEIPLEGHDRIPLRVRGPLYRGAEELLESAGIPQPLVRTEHSEGEASTIPLQDLWRPIGRGVVQNQELVVPPELPQDIPDFP